MTSFSIAARRLAPAPAPAPAPALALALSSALLALPLAGRAQTVPPGPSPALQALTQCRAVSGDQARLACFDAAAARLLAAEKAGDVVVVDREQARAARRQAFGFNLPSLDLFKGAGGEEDDRMDLVLSRAGQDAEGKWVLRTNAGQVWRQIDKRELLQPPRAGSRAEVRRGALGSFFMNVDGQRAMRVRREQ